MGRQPRHLWHEAVDDQFAIHIYCRMLNYVPLSEGWNGGHSKFIQFKKSYRADKIPTDFITRKYVLVN